MLQRSLGRGAHTLDSQTPRRVVTVAAAAARSQCWKRQDSRQSCPCSCSCSCPTVPALPSAAFVLLHFTLLLALARGRTRRESEREREKRGEATRCQACENCILRCATCHLPGQHPSQLPAPSSSCCVCLYAGS